MTTGTLNGSFLKMTNTELVEKINEFALRYVFERKVNGEWEKCEYYGEMFMFARENKKGEIVIDHRFSREYNGYYTLKPNHEEKGNPFPTYLVNEHGYVNGYCIFDDACLDHFDTVSQQEVIDSIKSARAKYRQRVSDAHHPWADKNIRYRELDVNELIKKEGV